ncbi:RNA pseudouridine synthase [candidate division GN15 bacterium]|uniref:Pseudouridine synthase n=1 Tax=candidate division GN15 bacterium TaxID=2072418 RepID=A0A855X3G5_9BACT|nr:MAG: RNA pseudouridine synthase [candidate division GN15 bacterium]
MDTDSGADERISRVTVPGDVEPVRIDLYLSGLENIRLSRTHIQKLIMSGRVTINDRPVTSSLQLKGGEEIVISVSAPPPMHVAAEDIPITLAYEDEFLLVVDKPAGMLTHPSIGVKTGTLVNALLHRFGQLPAHAWAERPGIVHRLDKGTSGLLLVARTDEVMLKLQQALKAREIHRTYLALVCGHMVADAGEIDLPIGRSTRDRTRMAVDGADSRAAVTRYRLRDRFRSYDWLEVNLETGRTHQIRVHLSHLGHPVFGDPEYGGREKWLRGIFAPERLLARELLGLIDRQALHACRLSFAHPVTGKAISIESPIPADYQSVIQLLERQGS